MKECERIMSIARQVCLLGMERLMVEVQLIATDT
jgi:hypothetical protein